MMVSETKGYFASLQYLTFLLACAYNASLVVKEHICYKLGCTSTGGNTMQHLCFFLSHAHECVVHAGKRVRPTKVLKHIIVTVLIDR